MRIVVGLLIALIGCGHAGMKPKVNACTAANADPGACLAIARARLQQRDEAGAREYMGKTVAAVNASPACLRDYAADGCFGAVIALLREPPVGLLAGFQIESRLIELVPRWTGPESEGRRMQARLALHGMCVVPGRNPIEQQRACIVFGDLVEDERMRRCGPACDPLSADPRLAGWSRNDVIDGYALACKVGTASAGPERQAALVAQLKQTYQVDTVCAIAKSDLRGASIPDALHTMQQIRTTAKQVVLGSTTAAKREAERLAAIEKSRLANAAAAALAEDASFKQQALAAISQADWPTVFGLLGKRRGSSIDAAVATALHGAWDSFIAWSIGNSNAVGGYLDLASRLAMAPKDHPIHQSLAQLRGRAVTAAKINARDARGRGGAWLHAAIAARIAGPGSPESKTAANAYAKLVESARVSLVIKDLAPACTPLVKQLVTGRSVHAKSTLECTVVPERRVTKQEPFKLKQRVVTAAGEQEIEQETMVDVTHRTFKVIVHGTLTVMRGAPTRTIPIDIDDIVDDVNGSSPRTFEAARAAANDAIVKSVVGSIEAEDAAKAHAAGLKALQYNRRAAAENQFVIHALLAGASGELDEMLSGYGVTFADLQLQ